jgi:uncharacterized protein YndB with AHSA1/START domain
MTTKPLGLEEKKQDLVINRVFASSREKLFQAWSDPKLIAQWWGAKTVTAPVVNLDFRVGGLLLYCMRLPDGQDIWGKGIYKEIVRPSRIVVTDSFADPQGKTVPGSYYGMEEDWPTELLLTLTFEDLAGKTDFKLIHSGLPAGQMMEGTADSWNESFDKLEELLSRE